MSALPRLRSPPPPAAPVSRQDHSTHGSSRRTGSPSEGGYFRVIALQRAAEPRRHSPGGFAAGAVNENQGHPSMIGMPFSFNAYGPRASLELSGATCSSRFSMTGTLACPA